MKILLVFVCTIVIGGSWAFEDDMQCNIKTCVLDLLDFTEFSFGALIRKIQTVTFCVKQCSPPIVHEFLQSISFAFSKRIPGVCKNMDCAAHNRFIALAQCAQKEAWPLLQCSKMLFDLVQLPLEPVDPINTTCSIVIETTQCFEDTLKRCGQRTYGLVAEILEKPLKFALNAYCHPSDKDRAKTLLTTSLPIMDLREDVIALDDESDLVPVAKKLKQRRGEPDSSSKLSAHFLSVLACLMVVIASSSY